MFHVFTLLCILLVIVPVHGDTPSDEEYDLLIEQAMDVYDPNDIRPSLNLLTQAANINSSNYRAYYYRGMIQYYNEDFGPAIDDLTLALDRTTNEKLKANLYLFKGRALLKSGRQIESNACFDEAERLNPNLTVPFTERYPYTVVIPNIPLIIGVVGIGSIIVVFFYREIMQKWR